MRIHILDQKENEWVLAKVSLWDYLDSLTPENFDYDIQRGIVKNPYLDSILVSIKSGDILPPFSLVSYGLTTGTEDITLNTFDILDGLQRTYRLWVYKEMSDLAIKYKTDKYRDVTAKLAEISPDFSNVVTPRQTRLLFDADVDNNINVWNLKEIFQTYSIYIYVWNDLSNTEAVKKMLILNAGQKRMGVAHQYELMYKHVFKALNSNSSIHLISEKDKNIWKVKKGERKIGEIPITTVIIGMQSLIAGKPIRLSSDMLFDNFNTVADVDFISVNSTDIFFANSFIEDFLSVISALDRKVCVGNDKMLKWFVKDTTISGLFAGLGAYIRNNKQNDLEFSTDFKIILMNFIKSLRDEDPFKIKAFECEYAKLESARINIGIILRKAISNYAFQLISKNSTYTWAKAFNEVL